MRKASEVRILAVALLFVALPSLILSGAGFAFVRNLRRQLLEEQEVRRSRLLRELDVRCSDWIQKSREAVDAAAVRSPFELGLALGSLERTPLPLRGAFLIDAERRILFPPGETLGMPDEGELEWDEALAEEVAAWTKAPSAALRQPLWDRIQDTAPCLGGPLLLFLLRELGRIELPPDESGHPPPPLPLAPLRELAFDRIAFLRELRRHLPDLPPREPERPGAWRTLSVPALSAFPVHWRRTAAAAGDLAAGFVLDTGRVRSALELWARERGETAVLLPLTPRVEPGTRATALRALPGWEVRLASPERPIEARTERLYGWLLAALAGVVVTLAAGIAATVWLAIGESAQSRRRSEIASQVSHELRTPLTSLQMFLDTLMMGRVRSEEEREECLKVMSQEVSRLRRIGERVVDLTRLESGAWRMSAEPVDLREVADEAVRTCAPLAETRQIRLYHAAAETPLRVRGDRQALLEVLVNLLSNAVDYSGNGQEIWIGGHADAREASVWVRDEGVGIPRRELRKIFRMYYRGSHPYVVQKKGMGLGLALCRYVAQRHGGRIDVDSAEGKGSTFTLRLPRLADDV